jgi:hypothetical protein
MIAQDTSENHALWSFGDAHSSPCPVRVTQSMNVILFTSKASPPKNVSKCMPCIWDAGSSRKDRPVRCMILAPSTHISICPVKLRMLANGKRRAGSSRTIVLPNVIQSNSLCNSLPLPWRKMKSASSNRIPIIRILVREWWYVG